MAQHNLLYYPSYVPSPAWLKLQLLFWDSVYRIVPKPMQTQYGDDFIEATFGIDPKWAPALSPEDSDLYYFEQHQSSIQRAFEQISSTSKLQYLPSDLAYGVHPGKSLEWVFDSLSKLGLSSKVPIEHPELMDKHYMVHPEAGKLILSCLASNLARRRNFAPITDQESQFFLTAANEVNRNLADRPSSSITASLGLTILHTLVPSNLDQLSFHDVISLRDDYGDLRKAFHEVVSKLSDKFGLEDIIDRQQADLMIQECVHEYLNEYERFNSVTKRSIRVVTDWRTQSFGSFLGMLGTYLAGGRTAGIVVGLGAASLTLANQLFSNKEKSDLEKSFHFIQQLNSEINASNNLVGIKPFLIGVRLGE